MAHTFLVEDGRWFLSGSWLDRDGPVTAVDGRLLVVWNRDGWYTLVTKLNFPNAPRREISFQYRGRFVSGNRRYTFVLQHSDLGRVEGEGWIAPDSIVQRYWVLNDRDRRTGFESLHRTGRDRYHLSSSMMSGHYLSSMMEGTLTRR
ncbi:MAG: hypothetical protein AAF289_22355 [Cyanobacteria bacterium P01_A01_bin.135]